MALVLWSNVLWLHRVCRWFCFFFLYTYTYKIYGITWHLITFYYFVVATIMDFVGNHTRCIPVAEYFTLALFTFEWQQLNKTVFDGISSKTVVGMWSPSLHISMRQFERRCSIGSILMKWIQFFVSTHDFYTIRFKISFRNGLDDPLLNATEMKSTSKWHF